MMLKLRLCVITCLDHRVGPAVLGGMEFGDVVVVRNVSGRVTDELMSLGVSGFRACSANWPVNATSRMHRTGNPAPEPTHITGRWRGTGRYWRAGPSNSQRRNRHD